MLLKKPLEWHVFESVLWVGMKCEVTGLRIETFRDPSGRYESDWYASNINTRSFQNFDEALQCCETKYLSE